MAQSTDPGRRLLLSWRPNTGKTNTNKIADWLDLFQKRMRAQCANVEVVDIGQRGGDRSKLATAPATDRAAERDKATGWTDFLAVLTIDYVIACSDKPDHELMQLALPALRDGVAGLRFWAVRLESGYPIDFSVSQGASSSKPWREYYARWHFIPGHDCPHLDTFAEKLDNLVDSECISRIKQHANDCPVCRGEVSAATAGPAAGGILHWLKHNFGRS